MTTTTEQDTRRTHLMALTFDHHRSHYGDYDDAYDEFAATYGLPREDEDAETVNGVDEAQPIPRYASIAGDETYGMLHLFDTLREALDDQAAIPDNGETLNVPCGVVDLDTGERVEYRMFAVDPTLVDEIKAALEGDSNDDEHDALASVAEALGIEWTPFDDLEDDEDA